MPSARDSNRRGESARGRHAIRVLEPSRGFTLDSLIAAAFDSYLTWFEAPFPALVRAWDEAAAADPLKAKLRPLKSTRLPEVLPTLGLAIIQMLLVLCLQLINRS